MTVITLDNIGNPKHRSVLRYISDVFDENRGKIEDHIALTKFNSQNHTVLFNTESPDLNGKTLIPFDNDKLLFAPVKINSIICSDPKNNASINILLQENNHVWETTSDEGKIKLFMRLDKSSISGFSIKFADAVRTKYRTSIALGNDNGETLTEILDMDSSWETNNHQLFQFSSPVDGVTKAVITLELVGTNTDFQWKIGNISLYSNMNKESLHALNKAGIITWSLVSNPTVRKGGMDDFEPQQAATTMKVSSEPLLTTKSVEQPSIDNETDHYGTPLIYAPDRSRQFFDNISEEDMVRMANLPRLFTSTPLPTGDKIYTFQTNENDRSLVLKFAPLKEMGKYIDETVTQIDKLLQSGEMKKGGFKNYILTMYVRLDNVNQTNQILLWKYGGFFFSKQQPQMARAVNVTVPINNMSGDTPHVYTEYFFERLNDMTGRMTINDSSFSGIEQGKWIGLQFIRQVDTKNKKATQTIRINKNPMDENGILVNPYDFQDYITYNDEELEGHIPAVWSGVNEIVSIVGAEYVSLYGISLYETLSEQ